MNATSAASAAWNAVETHAQRLRGQSILGLFASDQDRLASPLKSTAAHVTFDATRQRMDAAALAAMQALAQAVDLDGAIARLASGAVVNPTEGRAAQHMALRGSYGEASALREAAAARKDVAAFAHAIRTGAVKGATGAAINTIVHIGIGGSDLGPRLLADALKAERAPGLELRFASNVDGADIADALEGLDPARTLLAVVSKTFTTQETMANANTARAWLEAGLGADGAKAHLAAITAAPARAASWGCPESQVFPFWEWVGGRYSLWSAVGMSVDAVMKAGVFDRMLAGAAAMDRTFVEGKSASLPAIAGMVQAFNLMLGMGSYVNAPYARRLQLLPAFLQQLEMESNGKGVDLDGRPLPHASAPVTWGEAGTNGQHSFYQLLHQGRAEIPVEFVIVEQPMGGPVDQHRLLLANALAQAEALLVGKTTAQAEAELLAAGATAEQARTLAPHKTFPGDRPSTTIALVALTPESLGALLAFYEHRTFVQAALFRINPFDQWGVELGKQLADGIAAELNGAPAKRAHDPATAAWVARLAKPDGWR